MEHQELVNQLNEFRKKLVEEVQNAFQFHSEEFGEQRFEVWKRKFRDFLERYFPGEIKKFDEKLAFIEFMYIGESPLEYFWRDKGNYLLGLIDSLTIDVANGDYHPPTTKEPKMASKEKSGVDKKKIFIVHGHDSGLKHEVARFITSLGLIPVILSEQANRGSTIIEKLEQHTEVGFGIVLYTADDTGKARADGDEKFKHRARQNVILEHGFLMGKLSRNRTSVIVQSEIELPGDIGGLVYTLNQNWKLEIAKDLKAAGYDIDLNKVV